MTPTREHNPILGEKIYTELTKLNAEPDVTVDGQESPRQTRIKQLEGALAMLGLSAKFMG